MPFPRLPIGHVRSALSLGPGLTDLQLPSLSKIHLCSPPSRTLNYLSMLDQLHFRYLGCGRNSFIVSKDLGMVPPGFTYG